MTPAFSSVEEMIKFMIATSVDEEADLSTYGAPTPQPGPYDWDYNDDFEPDTDVNGRKTMLELAAMVLAEATFAVGMTCALIAIVQKVRRGR